MLLTPLFFPKTDDYITNIYNILSNINKECLKIINAL